MESNPDNINSLLDNIEEQSTDGDPSIGDLREGGGHRSLGPVLLAPSVIAFSPIGAITGMSIATGSVVILFASQLLFGRNHLWVPKFISARRLPAKKVRKGVEKTRKPAKWVDTHFDSRWIWATKQTGQ
jgi:hypothetical protein